MLRSEREKGSEEVEKYPILECEKEGRNHIGLSGPLISFFRLSKSIEYFFNYDLCLFFRERNPIHSLKVAEPQAHISKV